MNNQKALHSLQQIYQYPVKSLAGESISDASIVAQGIEYDRQWMLVDGQGKFLSQRKHPKMALIESRMVNEVLILKIPGEPEIKVSEPKNHHWRAVTIWNDQVQALAIREVDHLLQEFLQTTCHLVKMSQQQPRKITDTAAEGTVSFADGFPFLLIGTASLHNLNEKLARAVTMKNFRPNFVVETIEQHQEDCWDEIKIGEVIFKNVKLCSRCIMTTVDPTTAQTSTDQEPLLTLSKYRKVSKLGVLFGSNLIALNSGTINRGDKVEILSYINPEAKS